MTESQRQLLEAAKAVLGAGRSTMIDALTELGEAVRKVDTEDVEDENQSVKKMTKGVK